MIAMTRPTSASPQAADADMTTQAASAPRKFDSTFAFLRQGYDFARLHHAKLKSDVFQTRLLLLKKVIFMQGPEAARLFYDPELFERRGAIPKRIQKTLVGENSVQTLDGQAHHHRKYLFMSLMTPQSIESLLQSIHALLLRRAKEWERKDRIILSDEIQDILFRAACQWTGVPIDARHIHKRTSDLGYMVDGFGAIGPRHWRGRLARSRSEKWVADIIEDVRTGRLHADPESALAVIARHHDHNGRLLDAKTAAVVLLNLLRPIVAISTYISYIAVALHDYPALADKIADDPKDTYNEWFVQEVRRFYPFTPLLGARVKKEFEWHGQKFSKNMLVMLDVHGINHSKNIWRDPDRFRPERFADWDQSAFTFIPQGGGDYGTGHRCAGEWITIAVMKLCLSFLAKKISYKMPEQDLTIDHACLPTYPRSGVILADVRVS